MPGRGHSTYATLLRKRERLSRSRISIKSNKTAESGLPFQKILESFRRVMRREVEIDNLKKNFVLTRWCGFHKTVSEVTAVDGVSPRGVTTLSRSEYELKLEVETEVAAIPEVIFDDLCRRDPVSSSSPPAGHAVGSR
jgi:hypothetical protein